MAGDGGNLDRYKCLNPDLTCDGNVLREQLKKLKSVRINVRFPGGPIKFKKDLNACIKHF